MEAGFGDADGDEDMRSKEEKGEWQMAKLREVAEEFRERIEGNEWVKAVLANL